MCVNATAATWVLRHHLVALDAAAEGTQERRVPWAVVLVHAGLLAGIVALAHHAVMFLALFLMFLGFTQGALSIGGLLLGALPPTAVAAAAFLLL